MLMGGLLFGSVLLMMFCTHKVVVMMVSFLLIVCIGLYSVNFSMDSYMLMGSNWMGLLLLILSIWLVMLIIMGSWEGNLYGFYMLLSLLLLFMSFTFLDLFMFYVAFEAVLIPMFIVILLYGGQEERLDSGLYMLMYTVMGSLPLLVGLMYLLSTNGNLSFEYLYMSRGEMEWSLSEFMLMIAFLMKLPMYGLHLWLPKAHVEAPVGGSMILAGILLKLGGYGLLRIYWFLGVNEILLVILVLVGLIGGIVCSISCLLQVDSKKLIAYSSVVHSGLFLSGIMTGSKGSLFGGSVMMISHGLCSSGLFYLVNIIYKRSESRNLLLVKGSLNSNPKLALWGFLLCMSNMAAPPFVGMFGEVFLGSALINYMSDFMWMLSLIYFLPVCYMMYFFSLLCHGKSVGGTLLKSVGVNEYLILFLHLIPTVLLVIKLSLF